jgi:hypothetical protein
MPAPRADLSGRAPRRQIGQNEDNMSIRKTFMQMTGLTAAATLLAIAAPAADAKGPMSICKADLEKHCASAGKGNARVKCLQDNADKLTPDCKASVGEWKATRGALRQACKADRETLCKEAKGGLKKCLIDNQSKLSKPCAEALAAAPKKS